jgi:hypothetical protein
VPAGNPYATIRFAATDCSLRSAVGRTQGQTEWFPPRDARCRTASLWKPAGATGGMRLASSYLLCTEQSCGAAVWQRRVVRWRAFNAKGQGQGPTDNLAPVPRVKQTQYNPNAFPGGWHFGTGCGLRITECRVWSIVYSMSTATMEQMHTHIHTHTHAKETHATNAQMHISHITQTCATRITHCDRTALETCRLKAGLLAT